MTESKWNVNVRGLLRGGADHQNIDIINIQEAGSPPASAVLMQPLGTRLDNPDNLAVPVEEYEWNLGTIYRRNIYYIYFSRVDTGANRVNLAIVSRQRASRVVILGTSVFAAGYGRPVLGIEVDNSYYFNIHAIANGGSDSGVVTARVWEYFNQNNNQSSWMITGDFNRNPYGTNSLQGLLDTRFPHVAENVTIVSQNAPTQDSGGILDYAVVGQINSINVPLITLRASLFIAGLLGQMSSDHYPVIFYKR